VKVLVDTHTLFWYSLADLHKHLSKKAKEVLLNADQIFVPTIVILELYYLMRKLNLIDHFSTILEEIETSKKYLIITLDINIVKSTLKQTEALEMHDRVIVATSESLSQAIVTKDETIRKIYKNTIW